MLRVTGECRGRKTADSKNSSLKDALTDFRKDEDGSLIIFGLMMLLAMLMAGGVAIDVMRTETTRTQIQNTLDRAVLAATNLENEADAKAVVEDYFKKAGLEKYLDSDAVDVVERKSGDEKTYRKVTATARADVDSMFLKLVGIESLATGGESIAEQGISNLEISLVVDVSGSMSWSSSTGNSKIYELREAAKDFGYFIQCNPSAERSTAAACTVPEGNVSITLVPYSEQVLVGERILDELTVTSEHDYSNCVTFHETDYETPAVDPAVEIKRTSHHYDWPEYLGYSGSLNCREDQQWRTIRPFVDTYAKLEPYLTALGASGNTSIDLGAKWGAAFLDPKFRPVITELATHDPGDPIEGIPATPAIVASNQVGRPVSYATADSVKAMIVMTDGVNTTQRYLKEEYRTGASEVWRNTLTDDLSIYRASTDQYYHLRDRSWHDEPYGNGTTEEAIRERRCSYSWWYGYRCRYVTIGYNTVDEPGSAANVPYVQIWADVVDGNHGRTGVDWYRDWSWLEDPQLSYENNVKNTHTQDICDAAKSKGVVIYTIGFEVDSGETLLSNCATTPGHYFAANGSNLSEIFGVIATSLQQLRLTQ